jgi:hypothetical protein
MNYELKECHDKISKTILACDTKIGDLMRLVDPITKTICGHILVHHREGFISLNDPNCVWENTDLQLKVQLLPKGTKIKLKVK